MKLVGIQGMTMIIMPRLPYIVVAILLMSASIAVFTDYLTPSAHSQIQLSLNQTHKDIVDEQQKQKSQVKVIEASGHFANNQIENDSVSWIQGGLWHLTVYNSSSSVNSTGAKAVFSGNFTMVKPDGSTSHEHSIKDFTSNNVIIAGGDMILTGIGNIYDDTILKYQQVPIIVHLMGKQHVLGLIIDPLKTNSHFVSSHEMFGTLIKGTGLEIIANTLPSSQEQKNNNNSMNMNGMSMYHNQ